MNKLPVALKIVVSRTGGVRVNLLAQDATPLQQQAMIAVLQFLNERIAERLGTGGTFATLQWLEGEAVEILSRCGFAATVERHGRWTAQSVEKPASGVLQ